MRMTVDGVEHVWDEVGVCQIHGTECSMAPTQENEGDTTLTSARR